VRYTPHFAPSGVTLDARRKAGKKEAMKITKIRYSREIGWTIKTEEGWITAPEEVAEWIGRQGEIDPSPEGSENWEKISLFLDYGGSHPERNKPISGDLWVRPDRVPPGTPSQIEGVWYRDPEEVREYQKLLALLTEEEEGISWFWDWPPAPQGAALPPHKPSLVVAWGLPLAGSNGKHKENKQ